MFSNPRKSAVIENWPSGSKRVTAVFEVESNKKGERVLRTTTGKPKMTTYNRSMAIVDGDDGKTYILGLATHFNMVTIYSSDMKLSVRHVSDNDQTGEYQKLLRLLHQAIIKSAAEKYKESLAIIKSPAENLKQNS